MLPRDRYIKTLKFQETGRFPYYEYPIREATRREWVKQGYRQDNNHVEFFGLDTWDIFADIRFHMNPSFEEKILEIVGNHKIWIDSLGAKRIDFLEDVTPGFVTRTWLDFPVKNRTDFLEMKKRYIAAEPIRYGNHPERIWSYHRNGSEKPFDEYDVNDWDAMVIRCKESVQPVQLNIPFLFWTIRDWVGFENLCMMFYDNPSLIHEMFEFWTDFVIETLKDRMSQLEVDYVQLNEDMAYKHAPMISPKMFIEFMFPHYRRIVDFLKSNGVKIVGVDSDGYPGGLINCWIDAGVDAMTPCEIAAGCDILEIRNQYPKFALYGGIDKRVLSRDRKAVYNEIIPKLPMMLEKGGYIPHIDHGIPADALLKNYIYMREIIRAVGEGTTIPNP